MKKTDGKKALSKSNDHETKKKDTGCYKVNLAVWVKLICSQRCEQGEKYLIL